VTSQLLFKGRLVVSGEKVFQSISPLPVVPRAPRALVQLALFNSKQAGRRATAWDHFKTVG